MKIRLDSQNPPADEKTLSRTEEALGVRIPDPYRRFLLQHDGAEPEGNFYDGYEDTVGVTRFWSASEILDNRLKWYRDRIPPYMLPIAELEGGDVLVLSLREGERGAVYLWSHEEEADPDEDETPGDQNLYKIVDEFDSMLEGLLPESELDEGSQRRGEVVWSDPDFEEEQRRLGNVIDDHR